MHGHFRLFCLATGPLDDLGFVFFLPSFHWEYRVYRVCRFLEVCIGFMFLLDIGFSNVYMVRDCIFESKEISFADAVYQMLFERTLKVLSMGKCKGSDAVQLMKWLIVLSASCTRSTF